MASVTGLRRTPAFAIQPDLGKKVPLISKRFHFRPQDYPEVLRRDPEVLSKSNFGTTLASISYRNNLIGHLRWHRYSFSCQRSVPSAAVTTAPVMILCSRRPGGGPGAYVLGIAASFSCQPK